MMKLTNTFFTYKTMLSKKVKSLALTPKNCDGSYRTFL